MIEMAGGVLCVLVIVGLFNETVWCDDGKEIDFAVDYFASRGMTMVTITYCQPYDDRVSMDKKFSQKYIAVNWLDLENLDPVEVVKLLRSKFFQIGVLVDLNCSRSFKLLETAEKNLLLTTSYTRTIWLLVTHSHIPEETLRNLAESYIPTVSDHVEYLFHPYNNNNSDYLIEVNRKVNAKFLSSYKKPEYKRPKHRKGKHKTEVDDLFKLSLIIGNDVTVAIPGLESERYDLYRIFKVTNESVPEVEILGKAEMITGSGWEVELKTSYKKPDMKKGVLRAGSVIFQPDKFSRIDDLATRESDIWAKLSYPHVMLLSEDLNFYVAIRFYDDYGWLHNGSFGHVIGLLERKKADLSAAFILMRYERFRVADFVECPFQFQTGILFREPSLSSVSNIFVLPFARDVWVSIGIVIILTITALRFRSLAGRKWVPPDDNISTLLDINDFVIGAICQQGSSTEPKSISARTSLLILLLTSVALFTSYSASIVALLQSSSSAITTVADLTKSNLEVGIQDNFPLYSVLMKEATSPTLKEFYRKKVLSKGDKVYYDRRIGIEKMRTGMFAFEVELTAGYKRISETYEEAEKCGIKDIQIMTKPLICCAIRKHSPYKKIFAERLVWQRETGLFVRSWKLWADQKPKCEVGRIGFISVGLTEFRPALMAFAYGIIASLIVFLGELFYKNYKFIINRKDQKNKKLKNLNFQERKNVKKIIKELNSSIFHLSREHQRRAN